MPEVHRVVPVGVPGKPHRSLRAGRSLGPGQTSPPDYIYFLHSHFCSDMFVGPEYRIRVREGVNLSETYAKSLIISENESRR